MQTLSARYLDMTTMRNVFTKRQKTVEVRQPVLGLPVRIVQKNSLYLQRDRNTATWIRGRLQENLKL